MDRCEIKKSKEQNNDIEKVYNENPIIIYHDNKSFKVANRRRYNRREIKESR